MTLVELRATHFRQYDEWRSLSGTGHKDKDDAGVDGVDGDEKAHRGALGVDGSRLYRQYRKLLSVHQRKLMNYLQRWQC
jgi:hypothetical protein